MSDPKRIGQGRPGPGRPPGMKNKRTAQREAAMQAAAEAIASQIPGAFQGDAHAYLVSLYCDPTQPVELRLDAAKAAVRYEKPALASTILNATVTRSLADLTDQELAALARSESGGDGVGEALSGPH